MILGLKFHVTWHMFRRACICIYLNSVAMHSRIWSISHLSPTMLLLHANPLGYRLAANIPNCLKLLNDVELIPEVSLVLRTCTWPSRHCATLFYSPGTTWRRISGAARLRSSDYHGRAGPFVSTCSEAGSKYLKITRGISWEDVQ